MCVYIVAVQKEGVYFRKILYFAIHILMYTYVKTEKTKTCLLNEKHVTSLQNIYNTQFIFPYF